MYTSSASLSGRFLSVTLVAVAVMAVIVALTALPSMARAQADEPESTAALSLNVSEAEPGDTITVTGSGFRVGTEASFIYASTITIGGVPIASVASVDQASGFLHAGRTSDSGTYIAEHIDIDPADTTADGAFTADFVLPADLPAGDHYLEVTSCWGGPNEDYPEDGVAPCGTVGLGGGVNDHIARARLTILTPSTATLTANVSEAVSGETITVQGSGFRVGTEASFIYASTITIGGVPIASVASVDQASGFLHAGRTTDSGLYIAEHIDIDPADTTPDGAFTAQIVLPSDLPAGDHYLAVTSCWGGADDAYPEDGVAPCGTPGLGGGVNDHIARARITIPSTAQLSLSTTEARPGDTITVTGSGFRSGTEASFIYASTITVGGVPIASVASVDQASGYLHAGRTTDSGLYIAQHIDIDPADTTPDGAFTAQIVLPADLPVGDHYLVATACWGGVDEEYPEDGIAPCGNVGLGGGVNDRVAMARITIVPDPALAARAATLAACQPQWDPADARIVAWNGQSLHDQDAGSKDLFWRAWGLPNLQTPGQPTQAELDGGVHLRRWRWEWECMNPAPTANAAG